MSSLRVLPGAQARAPQAPRRAPSLAGALWQLLLERRIHRTRSSHKELLWTFANGLTVSRLLGATLVMLLAIVARSPLLLLVGLASSWLFDVADGLVARWRRRETVIGAQLDILADRVTAMWVVLGVVVIDHASALTVAAAGVVWVQLSFFDQLLASQFLRFGHWSPDEFHLEDERVWRLNWAPAAKLVGNLPLALLAVRGGFLWLALALALLLVVVRIRSYRRIMLRIGQLVTIKGHYDHAVDEAWLRIEDRDHDLLMGEDPDVLHEVDEHGRVVGVCYRRASAKLPSDLLQMLPPAPLKMR